MVIKCVKWSVSLYNNKLDNHQIDTVRLLFGNHATIDWQARRGAHYITTGWTTIRKITISLESVVLLTVIPEKIN
jgi:hypothetical protein